MEYTGTIRLAGKDYKVKVVNGVRYIDGKTVDDFIKTVDTQTFLDLAELGKKALDDEVNENKSSSYQGFMNEKHQSRNN